MVARWGRGGLFQVRGRRPSESREGGSHRSVTGRGLVGGASPQDQDPPEEWSPHPSRLPHFGPSTM